MEWQMLGVSLGPIESLSFAVVIGLSVDYLVHLAYAYKMSIMPERYFKSRSASAARSCWPSRSPRAAPASPWYRRRTRRVMALCRTSR